MRIKFDPLLRIAGIGLVPWTRLGPEKWFKNYQIASLYNWDVDEQNIVAPRVFSLAKENNHFNLPKLNSQSLINNSEFQQLLTENFTDYKLLTYKSVKVPKELLGSTVDFLSINEQTADRFEDKAYFRQTMTSSDARFPEYLILNRHDITTWQELKNVFNDIDEIVLQDSRLSGGKGTFMVKDEESLVYALNSIDEQDGSGVIVVSERVHHAKERTVQGVVTKHGIFIGPLQKQIVRDATLSNMNVHNGDKFCGAEIGFDDSCTDCYPEITKIAMQVGEQLASEGYKGIFGVDYLIDQSSQVYLLEVNPRITGVTPLLTALFEDGDIPFYLLHILELAGEPYEITDMSISSLNQKGSLLVIHAQNEKNAKVVKSLKSGIYDESLAYQGSTIDYSDIKDGQILLQQYIPPNFNIKPGGRLMYMYTNKSVLNNDDTLKPHIARLVQNIQDQTILENV